MRNKLFYSLFGFALISRVLEDLASGLAGVYSGELFPWRHLAFLPVAPLWLAIAMWVTQTIAGVAFVTTHRHRRLQALAAVITVSFSLTQMFQNQRLLLLAISLLLTLGDTRAVKSALKWQIVVVYLFSFLHKMQSEFWSGDVIRSFAHLLAPQATFQLRSYVLNRIGEFAEVASIATLIAEASLPVVLIAKPRVGFALVVGLHAAFALVMPDVFTFGLTMAALASLYLEQKPGDQASNSDLRA